MDSLPPELLRQILLHTLPCATDVSSTLDRSSLLCTYSLVSPLWRSIAQAELFDEPSLSSSISTDAFLAVVSKEPELGRLVRRLRLAGIDGCFDRTGRLKAVLDACAEAVELRLEHASVVCEHLQHPRESLLSSHAKFSLTQIADLRTIILHRVSISSRASPTPPPPLLPSLTHLSLHLIDLLESGPPFLSPTSLPSLHHLALRNVDLSVPPSLLTDLTSLLPQLSTLCLKPNEIPLFVAPEKTLYDLYTSLATNEDIRAVFRRVEGPIHHLRLTISQIKKGHKEEECLEAIASCIGIEGGIPALDEIKSIWVPRGWEGRFVKELEVLRSAAGRRGVVIEFEGGEVVAKEESLISKRFGAKCRAEREAKKREV